MADQFYLVSFDTDRIKDYVFATDRLREIRGASYLLTQLNKRLAEAEVKRVCPSCERVFFAGGSASMIVASEDEAKRVVNAVEQLYAHETHTASITGVYVPLASVDTTKGFGKRMAAAGLKLREAKDHKAQRLVSGIEPYTQACGVCERYPATRVSELDQRAICEPCHTKREAFRSWREEHESAPEDLSSVGQVARPPGYIGFIYADGNSIGERLKQLDSVEQYRTFADGLDKLVEETVKRVLGKNPPRPLGEQSVQPYEELLVGGDDLMLVTAGDIALPVALEIMTSFERGLHATDMPSDKPLTLGMAVVLAHASFPIMALNNLARQLLKRAKRHCSEKGYHESAIDFMVVTAAGSSDLQTWREEVLTQESFVFPHGRRQIRLTQRPYTLGEAQKLIDLATSFKQADFPRSQLQFLYEGLFHSQSEAIYRWGQVTGRVKKDHRAILEAFNSTFGDGATGFPPWRGTENTDGVDYTSALGDMIEIYPFAPLTTGGHHAA